MKIEIDMDNLSFDEKAEIMQLLRKGSAKFNVEKFDSSIIRNVEYTIGDIVNREWHVGESLFVPMRDGRTIEFIVAHRNKDAEVYFVSRDCIGESRISDIKYLLSDFEFNLPDNLLAIMRNIRHVLDGKEVFNGKIFIPSIGNVVGVNRCSCHDDEQFSLFKAKGGRVANLDGETIWWWTDSHILGNADEFWLVTSSGNYGSTTDSLNGVRVCFSI